MMAKKLTTLYIDDIGIRLQVTKGNLVRFQGSIPLEPSLIEGLIIKDTAEVASRIRIFLKKNKIRTRRVIFGISAAHSLTRLLTLPILPKSLLDEAIVREAKRLLPLAIEELYLSWQIVSSAEGKTQVFLAATRRKSIDSLMQTLKLAKLNVQSMTIKPLALARLVKDNKAIIVDVQQSEFDVIVLSGGVPQPIRTVPFSSASISWGEKTQLITEEIGRTVDFYNTTSGKTLGNDTILYTTGEFIDPSELRQSISSKFGFSVQSLKSSFIQLSDSRADYYFVNSSLAIQTQVASSQIAELNILPEVFRSKIKWGRVVAIPATVILAVVIAGMVILINDVSANIASVSDQLASSNKILQEKQLERQTIAKEIKTIESNLAKARPSLSEYGDFLIILTERADEINQDMLAVLENLPSNVTLKTFSLGGTSLAVSGDSESETEILSYARALEKTGRFSEVVISTINNSGNGEDGGMAFSLTLLK